MWYYRKKLNLYTMNAISTFYQFLKLCNLCPFNLTRRSWTYCGFLLVTHQNKGTSLAMLDDLTLKYPRIEINTCWAAQFPLIELIMPDPPQTFNRSLHKPQTFTPLPSSLSQPNKKRCENLLYEKIKKKKNKRWKTWSVLVCVYCETDWANAA